MSALSNITFRQLTMLRAIIECGNIARAADEIGLTAPAVSTGLKMLEEQIGASLLHRDTSGVIELTPIGEEVLSLAHEIRGLMGRYDERLGALKSGIAGFVSLGLVSTAKYFAPSLIRSAGLEYPGIAIDLHIGNRGEIIEALAHRRVDMAIMGRPPLRPKVDYTAIAKHPHIIIAPPDFEWDGHIGSLAREEFLVREEGSGTRILFERVISQMDDLPPIRRKVLASNETIKQAVIAGLGLAFISASTTDAELESGRLKMLELPGLPIMREWYIVWRADAPLSEAAQNIRTHIAENKDRFAPTQFRDPVV